MIDRDTIIILVILTLALGIFITFQMMAKKGIEEGSNIQAVQNWVRWAGKEAEASKGLAKVITADRPPVTHLYGPIEIKSESDFKMLDLKHPPRVKEILGDAMVDCWSAFDKGETNFLTKLYENRFCFPCVGFKFSDSIKKSHPYITGMPEFLKNNKIDTGKAPTYHEYLTNGYTDIPAEFLISNQLPTENDLYVFFVAAKSSWWEKIEENLALVGGTAAAGAAIGSVVPGLGTVIGAGAATLGSAIGAFFAEDGFQPWLVIGDPKFINMMCAEDIEE